MLRTKSLSMVLLCAVVGSVAGCGLNASEPSGTTHATTPQSALERHILAEEEEEEEELFFTRSGMQGDPFAGEFFFKNALDLRPAGTNGLTKPLESNGRSCATCHPKADLFALTPANAARRSNRDPLITGLMADADPDVMPGTPAFEALRAQMLTQLRRNGLIRVVHENPNYDPSRGDVDDNPKYLRMFRAVPTTVNSAAGLSQEVSLTKLGKPAGEMNAFIMWDYREESLEHQASTASLGHAQVKLARGEGDARKQLDKKVAKDIAAFQRYRTAIPATGLNAPFIPVKDPEFEELEEPLDNMALLPKKPNGQFDYNAIKNKWLPDLPSLDRLAVREAEGFRVFVGTPERPGCIVCHNLPVTLAGGTELFENAQVSEENALNLPVQTLRLWDDEETMDFVTVTTPDAGLAGITGRLDDLNEFKISQLRGISKMDRYFHDNHERDLDGVIRHYAVAFPDQFTFTAAERRALKAFLKRI